MIFTLPAKTLSEIHLELIAQKSFLKRILCVSIVLILIILLFAQMKWKFAPDVIISQNHFNTNRSDKHVNTIRCIVYVQTRAGRLGNRMFMVASAYGLARLHLCHLYLTQEFIDDLQTTFVLNLSSILLSSTSFNLFVSNRSHSTPRVTKDVTCQYIRELTRPNAILAGQIFELTGFWQSYLHFIKHANELRENIFIAKQSILEKIASFFVSLYQDKFHMTQAFSTTNSRLFKQQLTHSNRVTWIGVHVRRTDFVQIGYSSSEQYLFTAINYYMERYSNAHFVVASDDKTYCRNLFRNRSNIFVTPDSFSISDDLIILSLSEHSIATGGTFGWWAAFLANGRVIYDRVYPSGCEKREHFYPPWFLIDGNVRAFKDASYSS